MSGLLVIWNWDTRNLCQFIYRQICLEFKGAVIELWKVGVLLGVGKYRVWIIFFVEDRKFNKILT